MKKLLVVGVIVLFLGLAIAPSINADVKQITVPTAKGDTLYVGGNGTGNYSKIQDAINDSSEGDTVYVYEGIYYERVRINRTITFLGENRDTTIIDAGWIGCPVDLEANDIYVSGFTMRNSGNKSFNDAGIQFKNWWDAPSKSHNNTIIGNRIINNFNGIINVFSKRNKIIDNIINDNRNFGIYFYSGCDYNRLENNVIRDNEEDGIWISESEYIKILNNTIKNNGFAGISLRQDCDSNDIHENIIMNQSYGIFFDGEMYGTLRNDIYKNTIAYCNEFGLFFWYADVNTIRENNFIENKCHCSFRYIFLSKVAAMLVLPPQQLNKFSRNYWDDHPNTKPKAIDGEMEFFLFLWAFLAFTELEILKFIFQPKIVDWVNYDWRPAQEPYDIGV